MPGRPDSRPMSQRSFTGGPGGRIASRARDPSTASQVQARLSMRETSQMSFEIDTGISVGILDEKTSKSLHSSLTRARTLLVTAALFIVVGAIAPWQIDAYISSKVNDLVVVDSPQSAGFDAWRRADRSKQAYYVYDYENFEAILQNAEKPRVTEVGPFVYTVHQDRYDITFLDDGQSVRYREQQYYVYDPELSIDKKTGAQLDPMTPVVNVNVPLLALFILGDQLGQTAFLNSLIFNGEGGEPNQLENNCTMSPTTGGGTIPCGGLFYRKPVQEFIYGYDCPLLQSAKGWLSLLKIGYNVNYPGLVANLTTRSDCAWDGVPCSDKLGYNTMFTGKGNVSRIKTYSEFHNLTDPIKVVQSGEQYTKLGAFKAPAKLIRPWGNSSLCDGSSELKASCAEAARVMGSNGQQFSPNQQKNGTERVWVGNVFRHVNVVNVGGETMEHLGITLLRYTIPMTQFQSTPENAAAYDLITTPDGTLNLTKLQRGLDVSMSKPHFLDAEPYLYEAIDGWSKPDPAEHDTYIGVEPITGAAMLAHQRLQLNLRLNPILVGAGTPTNYTWFGSVSNTTLPLLWIDQFGDIGADDAKTFRSMIYTTRDVAQYLQYVLLPLGALLLMVGIKYYRRFAVERAAALLELEGEDPDGVSAQLSFSGPRGSSFAPQNPIHEDEQDMNTSLLDSDTLAAHLALEESAGGRLAKGEPAATRTL